MKGSAFTHRMGQRTKASAPAASKRGTSAAPKSSAAPRQRARNEAGLSRDEIVQTLEAEIRSGFLAPGARLDERVLGARFNVSRMPVRDAIGRLASRGLVDVRPRSGSYVAVMELGQLIELSEFMGHLETLCARYAALRMTAQERTDLLALAQKCVAASGDSVTTYAALNFAFHDAIYRGAKNQYLEETTRNMRQRIGSYRNYSFDIPGRQRASSEEHLAIAQAIANGDEAAALQLMAQHTDIKRDDYVPMMVNLRSARRGDAGGTAN